MQNYQPISHKIYACHLQTNFWIHLVEKNAFSFQFHWNCIPRGPIDKKSSFVQVMVCCQWQHAITWNKDDPVQWCIYASPGHNELILMKSWSRMAIRCIGDKWWFIHQATRFIGETCLKRHWSLTNLPMNKIDTIWLQKIKCLHSIWSNGQCSLIITWLVFSKIDTVCCEVEIGAVFSELRIC